MNITGIAHPPDRLHERIGTPSSELVYLAVKALCQYRATHLITSLTWGWEQALATAAIELKIPYMVAIPYPGRECEWPPEARLHYLDLLSRAKEACRTSDRFTDGVLFENDCWRIDRAEVLLALWDYDFASAPFHAIEYAIRGGKQAINLWNDWEHLYRLRIKTEPPVPLRKRSGAQIFIRKR